MSKKNHHYNLFFNCFPVDYRPTMPWVHNVKAVITGLFLAVETLPMSTYASDQTFITMHAL